MKVKQLAANMTEVELGDFTILFSYETPVAAHEAGVGVFKTDKKWSATTSKHINKWMARHGFSKAEEKEQKFFDTLVSL